MRTRPSTVKGELTGSLWQRTFASMTKVSKRRRAVVAPRAQQKLDTRERIRTAAWELFSTAGYEATTTKAVAERAGVATGTVFVHASDKADLLFLVMHDRLAAVVDAQFATLPPPSRGLLDQLLHIFGGLYRMYGEHPEVASAFVRVLPGAPRGPNGQQVDALTFGFFHRLSTLIRDAQQRGEVRADIDPNLCAQHAFALYYFALTSWIGGYVTIEQALDLALKTHLEILMRAMTR